MCSQHTLYFNSHPAPGLRLTPHFSPCVFGSVKAHFVVSEQWSIPVSNDFLWEVTAISTPEHWAACGLSVCRSGCLPSSFPSTLRGRRHFRGDRRVTASVAKPRAPRRQAQLHWNCKQRAFWVVWQRRSKGTFAFHWTWTVATPRGSFFLPLLLIPLHILFISSSVPPSVWCQGFGWRWQQRLVDTEGEPSSTLRPEPLPQPPPAWQWYFQS